MESYNKYMEMEFDRKYMDLIEEIAYLKMQLDESRKECKDYRHKYSQLLDKSLSHNKHMSEFMLKAALNGAFTKEE